MFSAMLRHSQIPANPNLDEAFFSRFIIPSLGPHPSLTGKKGLWRSFINDDHTPIEFSWSWNADQDYPMFRYAIEPIGEAAGESEDPYNIKKTISLVEEVAAEYDNINTSWFQHCTSELLQQGEGAIRHHDHPSQMFLAFELQFQMPVLKAYFMPLQRSSEEEETTLSRIEKSLHNLPSSNDNLIHAFEKLKSYLSNLPKPCQQVEMLAIDCTDPQYARIKIYVRSAETSLESVRKMMTLGGTIPEPSDKAFQSLRLLWRSVLSLNPTTCDADPLPQINHRTSGIIYHFDLRMGSNIPKCKVYIPVKHYGKDDMRISVGFDHYLQSRNKGLRGCSYLEGVRRLWYVTRIGKQIMAYTKTNCSTHRRLSDGLGFHTYISAVFEQEELAVTSYVQPEIYHDARIRS